MQPARWCRDRTHTTLDARLEDRWSAPFEATQHLIGNVTITFAGDEGADAIGCVRTRHRYRDHNRSDIVLWGEYHDRWTRADGVWRIVERGVLEAGIELRRDGGVPNPRRAQG